MAKSYDPESAVRFPLALGNHDIAWRYLFDWAVVGQALNCQPGDRVLDFAAGSGFVSELLNRLAYRTVALDLRPDILCCARQRFDLDQRLTKRWAAFVSGDGQRLPFADAVFDGVICLNALHHMNDVKATLFEVRRVLRPGARAVFSEPGIHHADSPESKMVVRQYGEVENNIVLAEIAEMAGAAGFSGFLVKPFVYPELIELKYDDLAAHFRQRHKRQGVLRQFLHQTVRPMPKYCSFEDVAEYVRDQHPLIVLTAPGRRAADSAHPSLLRARTKPLTDIPQLIPRATEVSIPFEVTNTGDTIWLSQPREFGGHVTFAPKLSHSDGRLVSDLLERTFLPYDVPPGDRVNLTARFMLPDLEPGLYVLSFDLVAEQVAWFEQRGSDVLHHEITVY